MEKKIARTVYDTVDAVLSSDGGIDELYQALGAYESHDDIGKLVSDVRNIVTEPGKIRIFDDIRPLIPLRHQMAYDQLAPQRVPEKLRVVHLSRNSGEKLGFAVRGGLEHGIGIFVSSVDTESVAFEEGLRPGDEIVRLNGYTIKEAIHEEVLNLIRQRSELILKVRNIGMIPVKSHPNEPLRWQFVENPLKPQFIFGNSKIADKQVHSTTKLVINVLGNSGLGCSICSGPKDHPGIFLQSIKPKSLAEEAGLEPGDQILDVNGTPFFNISHSEAVVALKGSKQLHFTICKGAGHHLLNRKQTNGNTENKTSVGSSKSRSLVRKERVTSRPESIHIERSPSPQSRGSKGEEFQDIFIFSKDRSPSDRRGDRTSKRTSNSSDASFSSPSFTDSRQINKAKIKKDGPLEISIEGGTDSALGGKIIVSEVFEEGAIYRQGGVHKGDELLSVDDIPLTGLTLAEAQDRLKQAMQKPQEHLELLVAKAPPKTYEDEITYF